MRLVYLNGESTGRSFELKEPRTTLGRETDNDIQLLVGGVSRYHAVFEFSDSRWSLRDLGSTNGTSLNGIRIDRTENLSDGDIIVIGDQRLRFETSSSGDEPEGHVFSASPDTQAPPPFVFRPPTFNTSERPSPENRTASFPIGHEKTPGNDDDVAFVRPSPNASSPRQPAGASSPVQPVQPVQAASAPYAPPLDEDIFGGGKKNYTSASEGDGSSKRSPRTTLRNNIIFAVLIIVLAGIVLAVFISLNKNSAVDRSESKHGASGSTGRDVVNNPFVLCYERMIIDGTSIFRFSLEIENGVFTIALDDIGSDSKGLPVRRKHRKSFPISAKYIDELKKDISESDFFNAQSLPMPGQKNYRRIIAGFDDKFNDIAVLNPNESREFMRLERSIEDFISANYIPGIFQTQAENYEEAIRIFTKADDAYATCVNNPQPYRLNEAVRGYKLAEKMFGLFSPPPSQYEEIRPKLAAAEQELARIDKEHKMRINMFVQQRDYNAAIETCGELEKYYVDDKGSSAYRDIREKRMELYDIKLKREKKGK